MSNETEKNYLLKTQINTFNKNNTNNTGLKKVKLTINNIKSNLTIPKQPISNTNNKKFNNLFQNKPSNIGRKIKFSSLKDIKIISNSEQKIINDFDTPKNQIMKPNEMPNIELVKKDLIDQMMLNLQKIDTMDLSDTEFRNKIRNLYMKNKNNC